MKKINQQKRLRTDIKHEDIIKSAKELFLQQGFVITTMDEIAQKAMVSKRTIYRHFENKEKLFASVLQKHWDKLLCENSTIFDENKTVGINLKNFAQDFLEFLYQQDTIDLFRLLIGEINKFPALLDKILINEKAPFTRKLIEFLQQRNNNDELIIEDAKRSAAYFMGLLKEYHFWPMMLGFTQQKELTGKTKLIDEAVKIFLNTYLKK